MSERNVVIFEDSAASNFNPLAHTRPVFELICGMTTLWKNITVDCFYSGAEVRFVCRDYLKDAFQQKLSIREPLNPKVSAKVNDLSDLRDALFVNGRMLAAFSELPPIDGRSEIGLQDGVIVYARLKADEINGLSDSISDDPKDFTDRLASLNIPRKEIQRVKLVNYLWELISHNGDAIKADFEVYAKPKESQGIIEKGAYIRASNGSDVEVYDAEEAAKLLAAGELPLYIGEGARIQPNVLVDLTGGPVYIGAHTDVRPPTIIDGPCCIMDSPGTPKKVTIIDGAKIRGGVTIGPVCRIGCEVEETIIQGYTNDHHYGFIGHAYLGEWVNVGAMTTNSDLRNDLANVKVPVNGQLVDTGKVKVGSFIGDHAKFGIGALLPTGAVVGVMTNVLSSGDIPPNFVPSFCFYREDRLSRGFRLKTLIEIAAKVMRRREVTQTPADVELLEKVYELTKDLGDAEIERRNRRPDAKVLKIIRPYERDKQKEYANRESDY
jgi:UDP-N-acetylglucosamine diphosphorylase/glucosamine-1-phosphate N-acetyltransferase